METINITRRKRNRAIFSIFDNEYLKPTKEVINYIVSPYEQEVEGTHQELELLKQNDISHVKEHISFHIWTDIEIIAVTADHYPLSDDKQYFMLTVKFPFTSNGQYFATASSFLEHGFSNMEYIEKASILRKLKLIR